MLKKRILVLGMILVLVMTNLSGCGLLSKVLGGGSKQTEEEKEEKTKDTKKKKKKKDKKKKDTEEEPEKEEAKQPEEIDVFEEMSGWCFCFCSGAGAWETSLRVESDGSFTGMYYDANMGETGPGYDDGTMYQCEFTGAFDSYEEVEPYIYTLHMSDLSFKNEPGEEEIIDNTLYIYTEPYGLEGVMDGTNDLQVYLAGAPTDALSEEAMTWIEPMHFSLYFGEDGYVNDVPEELPFPVLCNMGPEEAFFSDNVTYENKTYLVNKVQLPGLHPLTEELHEDGTYLYEDANDGATFIVRSACFELDGTYDIRQKAEDFVRACLAQVYDRPVTDLYVTAPNDLYSLQY
ncbi:MAG: hypothetical protein IKS87_06810, partial [Lachnospiraceae bacterium]|nr:hypothetical protein [Lachnospiraceae bacterium]